MSACDRCAANRELRYDAEQKARDAVLEARALREKLAAVEAELADIKPKYECLAAEVDFWDQETALANMGKESTTSALAAAEATVARQAEQLAALRPVTLDLADRLDTLLMHIWPEKDSPVPETRAAIANARALAAAEQPAARGVSGEA